MEGHTSLGDVLEQTWLRDVQKGRRNMNTRRNQISAWQLFALLWGAATSLLFLAGTRALAQSVFRPFSADQIHIVGRRTTTGKVFAMESAIRIESEEKGKTSVTIMRLDRKVMWILQPDQKTYMEMGNIGSSVAEMAATLQGAKIQRDLLGSEQVGAYHCDKYRVQVTYEGKVYTSIEWDAKELDGFAVKKQGEKGEWSTEYQNVQLGPQEASLFEIPNGYQKLDIGFRLPGH